jgi:phage antirepressor YoqD-like protein
MGLLQMSKETLNLRSQKKSGYLEVHARIQLENQVMKPKCQEADTVLEKGSSLCIGRNVCTLGKLT